MRENTINQKPEQFAIINTFIPSIQPIKQITLNMKLVATERVTISTKKAEDPIAAFNCDFFNIKCTTLYI